MSHSSEQLPSHPSPTEDELDAAWLAGPPEIEETTEDEVPDTEEQAPDRYKRYVDQGIMSVDEETMLRRGEYLSPGRRRLLLARRALALARAERLPEDERARKIAEINQRFPERF